MKKRSSDILKDHTLFRFETVLMVSRGPRKGAGAVTVRLTPSSLWQQGADRASFVSNTDCIRWLAACCKLCAFVQRWLGLGVGVALKQAPGSVKFYIANWAVKTTPS
eukprot:6477396-Amphidinium_carterae.1